MEYFIQPCSGKRIDVKRGQMITVIDPDGGQVVDFWVYTNPLPTPIYVQGWYFHYATAARAAQSKRNLMYIEDRLRGKANKPVEIIDLEIPTPDDTVRVVRKKLSLSRS